MICVDELAFPRRADYAYRMNESISDRIKAFRLKKGWRQQDLAERCSVAQGTVTRWEKGTIPEGENLRALTDVMGITVDALLSGASLGREDAVQTIDLPVQIPNAPALTDMMASLLAGVGLQGIAQTHAETLAKRFPNAFRLALSRAAEGSRQKHQTDDSEY